MSKCSCTRWPVGWVDTIASCNICSWRTNNTCQCYSSHYRCCSSWVDRKSYDINGHSIGTLISINSSISSTTIIHYSKSKTCISCTICSWCWRISYITCNNICSSNSLSSSYRTTRSSHYSSSRNTLYYHTWKSISWIIVWISKWEITGTKHIWCIFYSHYCIIDPSRSIINTCYRKSEITSCIQ